jgi:glycopeptide antibiotics resistance protein
MFCIKNNITFVPLFFIMNMCANKFWWWQLTIRGL